MFWKRRASKPGDLVAFIDDGSEIEGTCSFRGTVMLNGAVRGTISTSGALIVGETGAVEADVRAASLAISGQVTGTIVATERLELRRTARVVGDIEAPVVVIEEGAVFQGRCQMLSKADAAADRAVVPLKR